MYSWGEGLGGRGGIVIDLAQHRPIMIGETKKNAEDILDSVDLAGASVPRSPSLNLRSPRPCISWGEGLGGEGRNRHRPRPINAQS